MKTNKFIRIDIPGIMVYWMSMSETVNKHFLGHAAFRLRAVLSSNIGRMKRLAIDPEAINKIIKARDVLSSSPKSITVSIHEYRGEEKVTARNLNEQELWIGVGKEPPTFSPGEKASHLFRLEVLESLKSESKSS